MGACVAMLRVMRTPAEAIADILECIAPLEAREHVSLTQACGRVLAEDAHSDLDLPPFEKSAMDGFAVRSVDFAASGGARRLRQVGEARAGEPFAGRVAAGECVAIYTGSQVPADCDAVIMVERSRPDGAGHVLLEDAPRPGLNICQRGEDLRTGERVLTRGRVLRPEDLSVLAAVGKEPLAVLRRPCVHLATTGDELVRAHERPGPGQIREGNTLYLGAALQAAGVELVSHGIVRDDPRELERVFAHALDNGDALVTTGGVSMGKYDLVGAAFERLSVRPVLHKIAIKPGKPLAFGELGRSEKRKAFFIGLPGNPVSSFVTFLIFVRPFILALQGAKPQTPRAYPMRADFNWHKPDRRNEFLRVRINEKGGLDLFPNQSSGVLTSTVWGDGLVDNPPGQAIAAGDTVNFLPFSDLLY